jgi:hypothetical protein
MNTSEGIDPTTLANLLQNSSSNLIPDSLVALMTAGVITSIVISILFLIAYIFSTVRKWKVQSATLHMQKDISEIKHYLAPADAYQPQPSQETAPRPNDIGPNPLIAER